MSRPERMRVRISSTSGSPRRKAASAPAWTKGGYARIEILRHRADLRATEVGCVSQPMRQPVMPRLREAVDRHHPVLVVGELEDRGRHGAIEIEAGVDLVEMIQMPVLRLKSRSACIPDASA